MQGMRKPGSRFVRWPDRTRRGRRGAVLAAVVLLIALLNIAVIGSTVAAGDDARLGSLRVETMRAFLAAESGVAVVVTEINAGRDPPDGAIALPNGEVMEIDDGGGTPPMDVQVTGSFGRAVRRIEISVE